MAKKDACWTMELLERSNGSNGNAVVITHVHEAITSSAHADRTIITSHTYLSSADIANYVVQFAMEDSMLCHVRSTLGKEDSTIVREHRRARNQNKGSFVRVLLRFCCADSVETILKVEHIVNVGTGSNSRRKAVEVARVSVQGDYETIMLQIMESMPTLMATLRLVHDPYDAFTDD